MLKLIPTTVVVGMGGIYFFKDVKIFKLFFKSTHLVANVAVGLIFSVGFALLGYCPGTGVGAIGEGHTDAFLGGVLGMLVGAGLYAEVYHCLKGNILTWGSYGKITIPSILGMVFPLSLDHNCSILCWDNLFSHDPEEKENIATSVRW